MAGYISSVSIALDTVRPQDYGRNFALLPLGSGESHVAKYELSKRLNAYRSAKFQAERKKEVFDEQILYGVFEFLCNKIDKYRLRSRAIVEALSIHEPPYPMEHQAIAIGTILLAQQSKKDGWPTRKADLAAAEQLKLQEAMAMSPEDFASSANQARHIGIENDRYWVNRLVGIRSQTAIIDLGKTVNEFIPDEAAV